jgi:N-methylhydantoinase B
MTLGDFYAGIAALRAGGRGVLSVCEKYGVGALRESMTVMLDRAERAALARLAELPPGEYSAEIWIDDDGLTDEPIPIRVKVTIDENNFIADFTGSSPQVPGPINGTWARL